MTFGPDGKLYVTVGERLFNEDYQPEIPIAQDLTDRRGKYIGLILMGVFLWIIPILALMLSLEFMPQEYELLKA